MSDADMERAQRAFVRMVDELYKREGTGRSVISVELSEEMIAATIQAGAAEQQDAEISDVKLQLFENAGMFSVRVKVKGKAWPPRPPVDTRIEFGVRDILLSEVGQSGSVLFRVEKPLTFSSTFAEIIMGLLGKFMRGGPVSLDALRHKDSLITLDFAKMLAVLRPDLAAHASNVRLYGIRVERARVRLDVGFIK